LNKSCGDPNSTLAGSNQALNRIYSTQDAPAFSDLMANYAPAAQQAGVLADQNARAGTAEGNIEGPDLDSVPGYGDAPPASRSALGGSLSDAFNFATDHAKARGALGGYSHQPPLACLAPAPAALSTQPQPSTAERPSPT